eukprot:jgi/Mesvir1/2436/Mv22167-RA.1
MARTTLLFALNGAEVRLPVDGPGAISSHTKLADYLREEARLTGTKVACGSGGCGACTVHLAYLEGDSVRRITANSCLLPIGSIHGMAVTTIEGVGGARDGYSAVQQRVAAFHGMQCGYCTPGMVMSITGALLAHGDKGQPSRSDLARALDGNLCRCTGYRPLLDVTKSFARDVDIEELGLNSLCRKTGKPCDGSAGCSDQDKAVCGNHTSSERHPLTQGDLPGTWEEVVKSAPPFPEFLRGVAPTPLPSGTEVVASGEHTAWIQPASVADARALLAELAKTQQGGGGVVRVIAGNTASGVTGQHVAQGDVCVDIRRLPGMNTFHFAADKRLVTVGAGLTLSQFIDHLKGLQADAKLAIETRTGLEVMTNHLQRIAGSHVRNAGSLAGNLVLASASRFHSDLALLLIASNGHLTIQPAGSAAPRVVSVHEFLHPTGGHVALHPGDLITSLSFSLMGPHEHLVSYKVGQRPLNAHALVNGVFKFVLADAVDGSSHATIADVILALGTDGMPATRMTATESCLRGNLWDKGRLRTAASVLAGEIESRVEAARSEDADKGVWARGVPAAVAYVSRVGTNLFVKACLAVSARVGAASLGAQLNASGPACEAVASVQSMPPACLGHQDIVLGADASSGMPAPLHQPVKRFNADALSAGEGKYTSDVPLPPKCLHGAFVTSTQARALLSRVDASEALSLPGVVAFISAADIPPGGMNQAGLMLPFFPSPEEIFVTKEVQFHSQPLGLIVAESRALARAAAAKVRVEYEPHPKGGPLLHVDAAIAEGSVFPPQLFPAAINAGDAAAILASTAPDRKLTGVEYWCLGEQQTFAMELASVLALPDDGGTSMVVHMPTQCASWAAQAIAKVLGLGQNQVAVNCRRIGGGFGGKVTRSTTMGSATAIAAHKLNKPVHVALTREEDTRLLGGRVAAKAKLDVAFDDSGRITALAGEVWLDAGNSEDLTCFVVTSVIETLVGGYGEVDNVAVKAHMMFTNKTSRTTVRAPGKAQAVAIRETLLLDIARKLGKPPHEVQEANLGAPPPPLPLASAPSPTADGALAPAGDTAALSLAEQEALEPHRLRQLFDRLRAKCRFDERAAAVEAYNASSASGWRKRGISLCPTRYGVMQHGQDAMVSVFGDGSIRVAHGAVEMGQGHSAKVVQTVASALSRFVLDINAAADGVNDAGAAERQRQALASLPHEKITVADFNSHLLANAGFSGGSTSSEASCAAALIAVASLVERLTPVAQRLRKPKEEGAPPNIVVWPALIGAALMAGVSLQAIGKHDGAALVKYHTYGVACTEVEVDACTGEVAVLRADVMYDTGKSLNPAVDVGQVEGAFVFGLGCYLTEELVIDPADGRVLTVGPWDYKVPCAGSVPKVLNVDLLQQNPLSKCVMSSKAVGEPPLLLAASALTAVSAAVSAARKQAGHEDPHAFSLSAPATVQKVQQACALSWDQMLQ